MFINEGTDLKVTKFKFYLVKIKINQSKCPVKSFSIFRNKCRHKFNVGINLTFKILVRTQCTTKVTS